jgi:hypothetical protein
MNGCLLCIRDVRGATYSKPRRWPRSIGGLAKILKIRKGIAGGRKPDADARNARFFQDVRRGWELFQAIAERGFVHSEIRRQSGRAEFQIVLLHFVEQALQIVVTQRSKILGVRIDSFEAVFNGEINHVRQGHMERAEESDGEI